MSDERPRKSWRDIDKQRDGGSHRRDERPSGRSPRAERSQKSYRAALDRLFDSGRIGELVDREHPPAEDADPSRRKLLKAIADAQGRDALSKAVEDYLERFEMPADADVLARVLEHRDASRQIEAMSLLLELLQNETPRRSRTIIAQLKLLRDTSDDDEVLELAEKLLDRLD